MIKGVNIECVLDTILQVEHRYFQGRANFNRMTEVSFLSILISHFLRTRANRIHIRLLTVTVKQSG